MSETIDFWDAFGAQEETLNHSEKQLQELKSAFWETIFSQSDLDSLKSNYDDISNLLKTEHKSTLVAQLQENIPLDNLKIIKIIDSIWDKKENNITTKEEALTEKKLATKQEKILVRAEDLQKQQEKLNKWLKISKEMGLENLTGYQELKSEAEKQILSQKPELKNNPEELQKYTNTFILTYNQDALFAQNPWLQEKFWTQLETFKAEVIESKLFDWIELSRKYTTISEAFSNKPGVLKSEITQAQELLRADGAKLKIEWNQIISWIPGKNNETQIITIDENGVQKSISKYGYKINVPSMVSFDENAKREIGTLKETITQNNNTLQQSNDIFSKLPKTPEFTKNDILNLQTNTHLPRELALNLSKYDDIQNALEKNKKEKWQLESQNQDTNYVDMMIELSQNQLAETQKLIEQEFKKLYETTQNLGKQNQVLNTRLQNLLQTDFQNGFSNKEHQQQADNKARETLDFLNNLWITHINQDELQQIIDRINIHPQVYWLSKPFDLSDWLSGSPTDALKQKKEFFNLFTKIYEKAWFIPPVNESIIYGFSKDERLKNDTIFKQRLEDAGLTKWWSLQLESVMKVLSKPNEATVS